MAMVQTKYTKRQLFTIVMVASVNFFCSSCVSIQSPFYPAEAEAKGVTATEYGLVFGSFELVAFLSGPFFGKTVHRVGVKSQMCIGLALGSSSIILFGCLHFVWNRTLFITLSFLLRICESLGDTAAIISAYSLIGVMFPHDVATIFAILETFYGFGFIAGPSIGGVLFSLGGFLLPFLFLGILTATIAALLFKYIPNINEIRGGVQEEGTMRAALKNSSIVINAFGVTTLAFGFGFISATLEPHLRVFQLSPILTGFMFVLSGGTYAILSPVFGRIVDKLEEPKNLLIIACLLSIISFSILGPLPFLPIPNSLSICILALLINGAALSAGNVATFGDIFRSAIKSGFPDNTSTYGLTSSIWNSSFAFGNFIGPSIAGFLYDRVGFRCATIFVVVVQTLFMLIVIVYKIRRPSAKEGYVKFG